MTGRALTPGNPVVPSEHSLQKVLGTQIPSPFCDLLAQVSLQQDFSKARQGAVSVIGSPALQLPTSFTPSLSLIEDVCLFSFIYRMYIHKTYVALV